MVPEPATFRDRLSKARSALSGYFGSILSRGVDADTWDELEELLIKADVGVPTTMSVLDELRAEAKAESITDAQIVLDRLKAKLKERLGGHDLSLSTAADPSVWLFVGVNGVGKTTTIGKLAQRETNAGTSWCSPRATRSALPRPSNSRCGPTEPAPRSCAPTKAPTRAR